MQNRFNALLFGSCLAVGTFSPNVLSASSKVEESKPNILLILADDLGLGDLSCQYAKDIRTPNIDRIFNTGLRLTNCHANSTVSSPSRAGLLTGRFPAMVGVPGVIRTKSYQCWGYLQPGVVMLPQILRDNDYNTALIGKWHLGYEIPNIPNEKGFDFFHGFLGDMMDDYYTHLRHDINYMRLNEEIINPKGHATDIFTDWGIDYIKKQSAEDNPFFLYLAYNAPHDPLQPPVDFLNAVKEREKGIPEKRAKLVAMIEHLDYNIGKVMKCLQETNQLDNTIVIFTSDNGGYKASMANNGPTRGYKGDMYEGGLRVPCAVNMSNVFEGGKEIDNFIMLSDFMPTLCDYIGIKLEHEIDGISVLPCWKGEEQDTEDRYIFWVRNENGKDFCGKSQSAIRYKSYKLLQNRPTKPMEFYNIAVDSLETSPLKLDGEEYLKLQIKLTEFYRIWGKIPYTKNCQ